LLLFAVYRCPSTRRIRRHTNFFSSSLDDFDVKLNGYPNIYANAIGNDDNDAEPDTRDTYTNIFPDVYRSANKYIDACTNTNA
jgi:hypothetical protein